MRVAQFFAVLAIAVGGPAVYCRRCVNPNNEWLRSQADFYPERTRLELQRRKPDWVLVSNSMLDTRLNERTLSERSGHAVSQIYRPASMSAIWFLVMKRIVAESGIKPKVVSLFFRCCDLTWADYKITGQYLQMAILALDGTSQPEWQQVLGEREADACSLRKTVGQKLDALFPSDFLTQDSRRALQNKALRLTRVGTRMNNSARRSELNKRFSLAHLRHDLANDASPAADDDTNDSLQEVGFDDNRSYDDDGPQKFDPSPDVSFLPHMVALAKRQGFKLHVHRVKQRPTAKGAKPDSPAMQQYMTDLRRCFDENGCWFTDESHDPELTLDMYADGDHISSKPGIQKRYLENFWRRMQPLIGGRP